MRLSDFSINVITNVIIVVVLLGLILGLGKLLSTSPTATNPHKEFSIDGCDVYSFKAGRDTNYFARCASSVATTYNGKNIITKPQ